MAKKKHTVDLKREIIQLVLSGRGRVSDLAREHGIHPGLINKWVRLYRDGKPLRQYGDGTNGNKSVPAGPELDLLRLQAELKRYKEKVGEQALEIDFLKKAIDDSARRAKKSNSSVFTGESSAPSKRRAK